MGRFKVPTCYQQTIYCAFMNTFGFIVLRKRLTLFDIYNKDTEAVTRFMPESVHPVDTSLNQIQVIDQCLVLF